MDKVLQAINTLWPLLVALVLYIIWLVRLEGKNIVTADKVEQLRGDFTEYKKESEKDMEALRNRVITLESDLLKQIADVRESLARIEGALGISKKI